jgi:hypothetical protein
MTWRGGFDGKCLSKDQFTAHVASLKWGAWRPAFLTLHNTGAPNLAQLAAGKGGETQRIKNLEHYYRDQQGWSAGPHLFASPHGIYLGTPLTVPGTHTPSWNSIAWGLEMFGDYDRDAFATGPGAQVRDYAVHAIAVLYAALGREPSSLRLHKEDTRTAHKHCPGKNVSKADMIKRIGDAMVALHPGGHEHIAAA